MTNRGRKTQRPYLIPLTCGEERKEKPKVQRQKNRFESNTLGGIDIVVRVAGMAETAEPENLLVLPYEPEQLTGLDRTSIRVFRYSRRARRLVPVWNSGINAALGFVWAKVQRPGTYVPVGLPRDRFLHESLRALAHERRLKDDGGDAERSTALTKRFLAPFLEADEEALEAIRDIATRFEVGTRNDLDVEDLNLGQGNHPLPFHLPHGEDLGRFRERLAALEVSPGGLPEEELFQPLEERPPGGTPWPQPPEGLAYKLPVKELARLKPEILREFEFAARFPWVVSKDWPMYQHDQSHSGSATGGSSINSTTVGQLAQRFKVNLVGPVNSKPSIVDGRAYVGTSRTPSTGPGGILYKINVCNGCIEGEFQTSGPAFYSIAGIGGSPAVYKGKVYFTGVHGRVYCVDAATMSTASPPLPAIWETDLKNPNAGKKQPVDNPAGDCWSSPLVVNDRVYVGSGEGESATCWGFIWCLDANTGQVIWLFCTNKRQSVNSPGSENQPNTIPRSAAVSDPLPAWATAAGFSLMDDPPETGSSPWSSFAFDAFLNRVYVGTGNSQYPATEAPDQRYGSGLIALDATTGQFRGFHQAQADDSYHPADDDIDVPGAPTLFTRSGQRVVCYGSKNGSVFLLDADTLEVLGGGAQRRQLLARQNGSGLPGDRGNPIAGVATTPGGQENKYGVMATPAVHFGSGRIFVGLGGYSGAGDGTKTPLIRALNWDNLNDAWPTVLGGDGVTRYTTAQPPVYNNIKEAALSSPAVVNDVVFVSTTDPAKSRMSLYALDVATGLCLWSAPRVPTGWGHYALGPAVSGEYVVAGAGEALYVYTRPGTPWCFKLLPPEHAFELKYVPLPWWGPGPRFGG